MRGAWGADMYWAGDLQGAHFVHLKAGRGRLSVLSDGALWRSDRIGQFDHALFLRLLARDSDSVRTKLAMLDDKEAVRRAILKTSTRYSYNFV